MKWTGWLLAVVGFLSCGGCASSERKAEFVVLETPKFG